MPGQDEGPSLFVLFFKGLVLVMLIYGVGMIAVILIGGNEVISARMITAFSAMFSGLLGFGAGYLLGRKG